MSQGIVLAEQFIQSLTGLPANIAGEALQMIHDRVFPVVENHKLQLEQLKNQFDPQIQNLDGHIASLDQQIQALEDQKAIAIAQRNDLSTQYYAQIQSLDSHYTI